MSELSDEEAIESMREGARIIRQPQSPKKEAPQKQSDAQLIISAIKGLASSISSIANRPQPEINIPSPQVTVKPTINIPTDKPPRKWVINVTERDNTAERRIKSLTIEAAE